MSRGFGACSCGGQVEVQLAAASGPCQPLSREVLELMLKSLLRSAFAALGLSVLLVAAPAEAKAPPAAKPALWAVSDADTTIYLFGTIHLLPDNYRWRTPRFNQAVERSQELVVETIVDEKNPLQLASAMAS